MIDADAKRDAQRRMAWFSLTGMLLFPFGVVFTEWMELPRASEMLIEHEQYILCKYCRYSRCLLWIYKHG